MDEPGGLVHECAYDNDPERHFAKGGVIGALDEANKAGKVRHVGFTGHKHVATTISGIDSLAVPRQNLPVAQMEALQRRCRAAAGDGHLELYKSTTKYDGDLGRRQLGFPLHGTGPGQDRRAGVDRQAKLIVRPGPGHSRPGPPPG